MKEQSKTSNGTNTVTAVLFIIYLLVTGWILLFKLGVHFSYMEKRSVNLLPFDQRSILSGENILNVVIFVPLGIYVGILFERWAFGKKLVLFFLCSLVVEGLQYFLRIGAFDVTDLITNTVGGVTGWIILKTIENAFNNNVRMHKFINLVAATGTVLMLLLLVLLKMNLLPVRYQ